MIFQHVSNVNRCIRIGPLTNFCIPDKWVGLQTTTNKVGDYNGVGVTFNFLCVWEGGGSMDILHGMTYLSSLIIIKTTEWFGIIIY